jgi:hypothetical protein
MRPVSIRLFLCVLVALAACDGPSTGQQDEYITCTVTADCIARGGTCVGGQCHADNECATDADCTGGDVCVADPDFIGLCTAPGAPPQPLPAWTCTQGQDCPTGQGCGSDGLCHVDGECHTMVDPQGNTVSDCAAGLLCATGGPSTNAGFCTDERVPGANPLCRSDGQGACRSLCAAAADCGGFGATCVGGFCHPGDECVTTADCGLNHLCVTPEYDAGYDVCEPDPAPPCVNDPQGICRLQCTVDNECVNGGGCAADGLCHASNECDTDADCDTGLLCYPTPDWGGLCGPERPM